MSPKVVLVISEEKPVNFLTILHNNYFIDSAWMKRNRSYRNMADVEVYRSAPPPTVAPIKENDSLEKSFQERLNEIPLVTMTLSQLFSTVETLKGRNEYIQRAFVTGEHYVKAIAEAAKPVVVAATNTALTVAKPVVGEIQDPVGKLDSFASGALAKVEEKLPIITKTPTEMVDSAKSVVQQSKDACMEKVQQSKDACIGKVQQSKDACIGKVQQSKDACIEKIQDSYIGKTVHNQVDNAVSLSELFVEICFPTDPGSIEDMAEMECEDNEDQSTVERVKQLKSRIQRRCTKKLVSYKPVVIGTDAVTYAQEKMNEMNVKIHQGTNYVSEKSTETTRYLKDQQEIVATALQTTANKTWDHVYSTTMYLPNKAMQISGEVFISAKEMVFAYSEAHSITEMPHAIVEMSEKYYSSLTNSIPNIPEQAVAFVVVPAQVVSEYLLSVRVVEWIVPSVLSTDEIKIVEEISMEEVENDLKN